MEQVIRKEIVQLLSCSLSRLELASPLTDLAMMFVTNAHEAFVNELEAHKQTVDAKRAAMERAQTAEKECAALRDEVERLKASSSGETRSPYAEARIEQIRSDALAGLTIALSAERESHKQTADAKRVAMERAEKAESELVKLREDLDRALKARDHRVEDAREGMRVAMQRAARAEKECAELRAFVAKVEASAKTLRTLLGLDKTPAEK